MKENEKATIPKCNRSDCFANDGGFCLALRDSTFNNGCPFYKGKDEISMTEIYKSIKAYGLIKEYYINR